MNKVVKTILDKKRTDPGWMQEFFIENPNARRKFVNYAQQTNDMKLQQDIHDCMEGPVNYSLGKMKLKSIFEHPPSDFENLVMKVDDCKNIFEQDYKEKAKSNFVADYGILIGL